MTKNTDSDRVAYPALPEPLQTSDLVRLFTPTSDEIDWASSVTRSEHTRCHVLTLLKVFQTLGRFRAITGIPHTVVGHVARCVGLPEAHANEISGSRPTLYRHQHLVVRTWACLNGMPVRSGKLKTRSKLWHRFALIQPTYSTVLLKCFCVSAWSFQH